MKSASQQPQQHREIELVGVTGSNPLGFLSAIGTFVECSRSDPAITIRWVRTSGAWRPVLGFSEPIMPSDIAGRLSQSLRLEDARELASDTSVTTELADADKAHMQARKAVRDADDLIKKQKLRGPERETVVKSELDPLQRIVAQKKQTWLEVLKRACPSPELALGKDPAAQFEHFRNTALELVANLELRQDRRSADLLSAFGSDAIFDDKTLRIRTTPFCFVTGSGHQYFLQTVGELLSAVDAARIHSALFETLPPTDEKLSLRWDPVEDRRYAMMWSDPTASGNKATTNWALNLLAYRGLQLYPTAPLGKKLGTTGFSVNDRQYEFSWPLWSAPLKCDTVRSLLASQDVQVEVPDRKALAARGVDDIYRAARLMVGNPPLHKLNFSPARAV